MCSWRLPAGDPDYGEQPVAHIRLRIERRLQLHFPPFRPKRKTNNSCLTRWDDDRLSQIQFAVVEKQRHVRRFALEFIRDLRFHGMIGVPGVQDGNRSMTGDRPIRPTMHRRQSYIYALIFLGSKKQVDDFLQRHFARSNEKKSRSPLLKKQLL